MKFFKKFIPLCLSVTLFSSFPVMASNSFPELDTAQEDVFVGIKRIEGDEKKLKAQDIQIPSNIRDLRDGVYVLNRGTGWIVSEEENFLTSSFIDSGVSSNIKNSKAISITHKAITGAKATFNLQFVKVSLEATYENAVSNEEVISASFNIKAPSDKNLYVKLYSTHSRYDTIKIRNGEIVEHDTTFIPEGTWAKVIEYDPGQTLNLSKYEEKVTRCVLGENPLDNIKNSIEVNGVVSEQTKSFKLYLDYNAEEILLANRSSQPIHEGFGEKKYFKFSLLNSNRQEKKSFELQGKSSSKDSKYDDINGLQFEIGDFIELESPENFRTKIYDYDGNLVEIKTSEKMLFEITESGLKQVLEETNPGRDIQVEALENE